jgi:hypothetical protein
MKNAATGCKKFKDDWLKTFPTSPPEFLTFVEASKETAIVALAAAIKLKKPKCILTGKTFPSVNIFFSAK